LTDRRTVQIVVVFLGLIALGGLAAITYLIDNEADASSIAIISGLTGTALGALGGLLTNSASVSPMELREKARNEAFADVGKLAMDAPVPVVMADTAEVAVSVDVPADDYVDPGDPG
jgi:hypothetical protein